MYSKKTNIAGFTLIEITIATMIFAIIMLIVSQFYSQTSNQGVRARVTGQMNEEARFTLLKISQEITQGGIDYQKYWERNSVGTGNSANTWQTEGPNGVNFNRKRDCGPIGQDAPPTYDINADNLFDPNNFIIKNYKYQFIHPGNNNYLNCVQDPAPNTFDDDLAWGNGPRAFNGTRSSTWNSPWKGNGSEILFLINDLGTQRTWFRVANDRIEIMRLRGYDADNDGINEVWICEKNYTCNGSLSDGTLANGEKPTGIDDGWTPITPETLRVTQFEFILTPEKDPYKAFNDNSVQFQPHVILFLGFQPTDTLLQKIGIPVDPYGTPPPPTINLQTTVTTRIIKDLTVFDE